MPSTSFDQRQDIAVRLTGGQTAKSIASTLGLSVKTVYRLRKQFKQPDGSLEAVAASNAPKQAFNREQLVEISQWLTAEPKLTLKELREKAVTEGFYIFFFFIKGGGKDMAGRWRRRPLRAGAYQGFHDRERAVACCIRRIECAIRS